MTGPCPDFGALSFELTAPLMPAVGFAGASSRRETLAAGEERANAGMLCREDSYPGGGHVGPGMRGHGPDLPRLIRA